MTSYNAFSKNVIGQNADLLNQMGAVGGDSSTSGRLNSTGGMGLSMRNGTGAKQNEKSSISGTASPISKLKDGKKSISSGANNANLLSAISYGGVQMSAPGALTELRNKDIGSIIKNKEIFEKA